MVLVRTWDLGLSVMKKKARNTSQMKKNELTLKKAMGSAWRKWLLHRKRDHMGVTSSAKGNGLTWGKLTSEFFV